MEELIVSNVGFTPKEAIKEQKRLRKKVRIRPLERKIRIIAGADVSFERFGTALFAGMTVSSYPDLTPMHHAVAKIPAEFPYIPGLLSFREIPGLLECLAKLPVKPDLIMVDGQGIAHPRRIGIAAHLGVISGIPTIGCAKSGLYGSYKEPTTVCGVEPIIDPQNGETIGFAFKSKARTKPLVISPGHNVSLEESLEIVQMCLRGYRLPEPTRRAHVLVNRFRKGEIRE